MNTTTNDVFQMLKSAHHHRRLLAIAERKLALRQLNQALSDHEEQMYQALEKDLGRPRFESYVLEIAFIKQEIKTALASVSGWSKPHKVKTPIQFQPGASYIEPTPKGVVLIISPWNYPFQLSLVPLISAIAAGNCAIIKPSEIAGHSALVIADIVNNYLDQHCFRVINGDVNEAQNLLDLPFDHIFFTGSTLVGREVMKKASHNLTPVTLELGGKSPAIIDEDCDLNLSIKRLLWGKFINAGQTCIAPDYVLVPNNMVEQLVTVAKSHLASMFGNPAIDSKSYGRIINQKHLQRLTSYLHDGRIAHGGGIDEQSRFIEPTLLVEVNLDAPVMHDEVFGPILPIIGVNSMSEAIDFINKRPTPLALYIFSRNNQTIESIIKATNSGGVCINDCLSHAGIIDLPFGGVGHSGFGNYHGKYGFLIFSHLRSIHKRSTHLDNPLKYPPYSDHKLKMARFLL